MGYLQPESERRKSDEGGNGSTKVVQSIYNDVFVGVIKESEIEPVYFNNEKTTVVVLIFGDYLNEGENFRVLRFKL